MPSVSFARWWARPARESTPMPMTTSRKLALLMGRLQRKTLL